MSQFSRNFGFNPHTHFVTASLHPPPKLMFVDGEYRAFAYTVGDPNALPTPLLPHSVPCKIPEPHMVPMMAGVTPEHHRMLNTHTQINVL